MAAFNVKTSAKIPLIIISAIILLALGIYGLWYLLTPVARLDLSIDAGVEEININELSEYNLALIDGVNQISTPGVYTLSGSIDGSLIINAAGNVKLILDNVSIVSPEGPAILVEEAKNVYIELVGDNSLTANWLEYENHAALFSHDDLAFSGWGSLKIIAENYDAIVGNDDLQIDGGTYILTAADDAISANDSIKITAGSFFVTAEDDAFHSDGDLLVEDGDFSISAGDDAFHADGTLQFDAGTVNITKTHEGLEGLNLVINGGNFSIVADDDGLNAAGGADASGFVGEKNYTATTAATININAGYLYINAAGDGIDSNGYLLIAGGEVYIDGPTNSADSALDYEMSAELSGGTVVAVGAAGMAANFTSASQPVALINLARNYTSAFTFGQISFSPAKAYSSILISSPEISLHQSYDLVIENSTVSTVTFDNYLMTVGNSNFTGEGGPGQRQSQQNKQPQNRR